MESDSGEVARWSQLSGFQRDLLFAMLSAEKSHGLGIKREMEENYDTAINHGRLYPNLDTLVKKGLIEKGEIDKRTNFYRISETGEGLLKDIHQWQQIQLTIGDKEEQPEQSTSSPS